MVATPKGDRAKRRVSNKRSLEWTDNIEFRKAPATRRHKVSVADAGVISRATIAVDLIVSRSNRFVTREPPFEHCEALTTSTRKIHDGASVRVTLNFGLSRQARADIRELSSTPRIRRELAITSRFATVRRRGGGGEGGEVEPGGKSRLPYVCERA